jgi:hypothetical protein
MHPFDSQSVSLTFSRTGKDSVFETDTGVLLFHLHLLATQKVRFICLGGLNQDKSGPLKNYAILKASL